MADSKGHRSQVDRVGTAGGGLIPEIVIQPAPFLSMAQFGGPELRLGLGFASPDSSRECIYNNSNDLSYLLVRGRLNQQTD